MMTTPAMGRFGRPRGFGKGEGGPRRRGKPLSRPNRGKGNKPAVIHPLIVIREAGVRIETFERVELRRKIKEFQGNGDLFRALGAARSLIATEAKYFREWGETKAKAVGKAIYLLEEMHDRLARKDDKTEIDSRKIKQYLLEIQKGNKLLLKSATMLRWGLSKMEFITEVLDSCVGKTTEAKKYLLVEEIKRLNQDGLFRQLLEPKND